MKKVLSVVLCIFIIMTIVYVPPIIVKASTGGHNQSEAVAWAKSKLGQSLDYDGAYGAQCVDLIAFYYQYLGNTTPGGNAYQYCNNNLPSGWKRITNYSGFTPNPGDICVWGPYAGGNYANGHVAIMISGNSTTISTIDQNYNENRKTEYHSWNTSQVTCFIRPDFPTEPDPHPVTPTQCVSDGEYHVVSALDNSLGLNVASNSKSATANVQIWNNMDEANETSLVTVKHVGSGYYTLTFKNSGKNLDVYNANKTSGTNVWQYDKNNNDAQKWIIKSTGDGYFNIITKLNTNLYLDVSGGTAKAGSNVQIYTGNGSKAQKWKFLASGVSSGNKIKNGEYTVASAINNYYGLNIASGSTENGANIHLWGNMNVSTNNAIVTVKHLGNGLYSIIFKKSNKALDVKSGSNISGANVQQWSFTSSNNQKWIIKSAGSGYYYIISRCSGLALDATGGKAENKVNIQAHILNNSNAQKWKFNLVKNKITYKPNGGSIYNDTVSSANFNGSNSSRDTGKMIIYTSNMFSKTTTNEYGDEVSYNKDGKKVAIRTYGTKTGLAVPSGGFVVSKHAENKFDLYNAAKSSTYAFCDFNAYTVYFFKNEHDYKAGSKMVTPGSAYGTLATPVREGYKFDGWYSSANGGSNITATSTYNGTSTLYAHWTKIEEEMNSTEPDTKLEETNPVEPDRTTSEETATDTSENVPTEITVPKEENTVTETEYNTTATESSETSVDTTEGTETKTESEESIVAGFYVVGSEEVCGAEWGWDKPYKYSKPMKQASDGTYFHVVENVKASKGNLTDEGTDIYVFKVVYIDENGGITWHPGGLGNNTKVTVAEDGSTLLFQFKLLASKPTKEGLDPEVVKVTVYAPNDTKPSFDNPQYPEESTPATEATLTVTTELGTSVYTSVGVPEYVKKGNTVKVTVKNKALKAKKLKVKKQTVKPLKIKNAKGTVNVVKLAYGTSAKIFKKITINSKTGAITFKKGKYAKKTYKIMLKITAKGNANYKMKSITKTVKIKIK